jgi:hypothetical protein
MQTYNVETKGIFFVFPQKSLSVFGEKITNCKITFQCFFFARTKSTEMYAKAEVTSFFLRESFREKYENENFVLRFSKKIFGIKF